MTFRIEDRPMTCCGMQQAQGFSDSVVIPGGIKNRWGDYPQRTPTEADLRELFVRLDSAQESNERNVSMITLSSDQPTAKRIAEENGYVVIQEFYNPNSENQVFIMTKTKYANKAEYDANRPDFEDSNW
jgi:hypothetical protein